MKKLGLVVCAMLVFSMAAHANVKEKKARRAVNNDVTTAAKDIKGCAGHIKLTYDWNAFDKLDWKKLGREKMDYYPAEQSNIADIGKGVSKVCADKDYRDALKKVTHIVYKASSNDSITLTASVKGNTLTLENNIFGSTRHTDDYVTAIESAL